MSRAGSVQSPHLPLYFHLREVTGLMLIGVICMLDYVFRHYDMNHIYTKAMFLNVFVSV